MMKLLSWNSRGMGHPSKTAALKDLLHSESPEIVLLQETKQNQNDMQTIIESQKSFIGISSASRGASGGITTMWKKQYWNCASSVINSNWIRTNLVNKEKNWDIIIYNIYVPNHFREKEQCWNELKQEIDKEQNTNLILAGDLNLILHANEKRGGVFTPDPFRRQLETIMAEVELLDIKPKNRKYTWNNRRLGPGNIMERLDRILINVSLLSNFAAGHSKILSATASDHSPILLTLDPHANLGPIPFRYNPLWKDSIEAESIIAEIWKKHVEGSPNYIWETKIRNIRKALKDWAKTRYQEPEKIKGKLQQSLEEIQKKIEEQGFTNQLKDKEWEVQEQLTQIKRAEEVKWRLKSRETWLKEGDKNTAYFHKQATVKKSRNIVTSITDSQGSRHDDQDSIKEAAFHHYKNLLTENGDDRDYTTFLQHLSRRITAEENERMNREITEEEVKKAIWTLQPDKSPGPDGFSINFYRDHWYLIKKDLVKMMKGIQRKKKMGGFTNSTYLALIPKESRPTSFSRFRPISLCNTSYKIFAKIIAARLQPLLPTIISENQGGFMANRQIHDSITLVQEAIHSSTSRQEKGFVLKLDLANAFDRVRHSFLYAVMGKMGFSPEFISTIAACITGPWISPLINGRPCESFQSSRGLRQGCPLSPYLFIMMAESFSSNLDHNRRVGLISGIKYGNGVKNINHSQFADDTLLIGGASTTIARRFKSILDQFMECSGGEVNFHKSCIYGWNISSQTAYNIANIFGVAHKETWDHFTYLGMPVTLGNLKASTWSEVIDKVKRKVQQWGTQWLNPAGRLILLKSGISSLPLYRFTLYHAPASFHNKLEIALRNFLWQGGRQDKGRFNLVNWRTVIQSPDRGGLGIRMPKFLNLAFGIKMAWRLISEPKAWWKQVLECKYLTNSRQRLLEADIPTRDSTKIWQLCKKAIPILIQNTSKIPGDGSSINYATDKIMGLLPTNSVEEAIPIIHYLHSKGIQRLDQISKWDEESGAWLSWEFPDIPPHLGSSLQALIKNLQNRAPIKKGALDGLRWDPTGSGYTIKSGYQFICNSTYQSPVWNQWRIIWKSEAIPKVKFFIWLLLKRKILTSENLKKRGIYGPSICPNCCSEEETIHHLFLECAFAKRCWTIMAKLGELNWQPQQNIAETILYWRRNCPWKDKRSKIVKRTWDIIPHNLLWKIWITRNKKIFQNQEGNARITCRSAHLLAQETIVVKCSEIIKTTDYTTEERIMINHILDSAGQHHSMHRRSVNPNYKTKQWEIRLPSQEFQRWMTSNNCPILLFDGASKSNPGPAGAGGVILDEKGEEISSYEWSLGVKTNNIAEALALFQGLQQLQKRGIKKAIVLGDSAIVIGYMNHHRPSSNSSLHQHLCRIHLLTDYFNSIRFYHILRIHNGAADRHANKAVGCQEGTLRHSQQSTFQPLP